MNRREFLGAAALATAAGLQGKADGREGAPETLAARPRAAVNTFPELKGPEFQGMEGAFVPISRRTQRTTRSTATWSASWWSAS